MPAKSGSLASAATARPISTHDLSAHANSVAGSDGMLFGLVRWIARLAPWAVATAAVLLGCVRALTWLSGAMVATITATMASGQVPVVPEAAKHNAAILKVADAYRQAVLNGDLDSLVALYRDDALEMPFHQPPIRGQAAIRVSISKCSTRRRK